MVSKFIDRGTSKEHVWERGPILDGNKGTRPPFLGDSLLCGTVILRLKAGRGHSDYVPMAIMFLLVLNSLKSF